MDNSEARKRSLANLKHFPKGVSGNPKGRKPGIKNWSTVVQKLLADEELIDKVVKSKPSYWNELPSKNGANAIVVAMMIKAMSGDDKAAKWLTKTGFGDKIDLTSAGERLVTTPIVVSQIEPRNIEIVNAESETESTESN